MHLIDLFQLQGACGCKLFQATTPLKGKLEEAMDRELTGDETTNFEYATRRIDVQVYSTIVKEILQRVGSE